MSGDRLLSGYARLCARRASEQNRAGEQNTVSAGTVPVTLADAAPVSRAPDGTPCWFIPASAIEERLEALHPRGAA